MVKEGEKKIDSFGKQYIRFSVQLSFVKYFCNENYKI